MSDEFSTMPSTYFESYALWLVFHFIWIRKARNYRILI